MRIFQRKLGGPWHLDYREGGKRCQPEIGTKLEAEAAMRRRTAERVLRRRGRGGQTSNRVLIATVKTAWLQSVEIHCKPRTAHSYEECLEEILKRLPAVQRVDQLRLVVIDTYTASRTAGENALSARRLNMQIGAVKQMLRWAETVKIIERNPLADVKPLKVLDKRYRRALTEAEVRALLEKSPPCYRRIWSLMLQAGLRFGETVTLTWKDVDLDRAEIFLSAWRSKNNTAATVPLSASIVDMLRELKGTSADQDAYVFVNRAGRPWKNNLLKRFQSCCKAAKINLDGVCLHSLRYTFATHLLRAGVPIATVQRLGRWKTVNVLLSIYAKSFPADEREAVEQLSARWNGAKAETETAKAEGKRNAG